MLHWLLLNRARTSSTTLCYHPTGYNYQQTFNLVNLNLKWVNDNLLDSAVSSEKHLKAVCTLVSILSAARSHNLPIYKLNPSRGHLGLPHHLKLSTFIRRYPNIFHEFSVLDTGGTKVPCFELTRQALSLHRQELDVMERNKSDVFNRLQKLLMLTRDMLLPLQTIDQLKWDLGLPYNYCDSLFMLNNTDLFSVVRLPDHREGLKLMLWDDRLAVSKLQQNVSSQQTQEDVRNNCLAFPIGFTRGYGLKRKCTEWLKEWQALPYTSPYQDPSHLDPRTDVSEKRIVGVFHELLHLMLQKKTERKNVSNLRKPLSLPQKFTKVFERHPAIFYISKKCDTQTVILREGYNRHELLEKHPLVGVREKFANMMRQGFLDRSKGLYKRTATTTGLVIREELYSSGGELQSDLLSLYESDDDPIP
ncbi:hypothetical protein ACFE04_004518 [Oxalis oulophora]